MVHIIEGCFIVIGNGDGYGSHGAIVQSIGGHVHITAPADRKAWTCSGVAVTDLPVDEGLKGEGVPCGIGVEDLEFELGVPISAQVPVIRQRRYKTEAVVGIFLDEHGKRPGVDRVVGVQGHGIQSPSARRGVEDPKEFLAVVGPFFPLVPYDLRVRVFGIFASPLFRSKSSRVVVERLLVGAAFEILLFLSAIREKEEGERNEKEVS